MLTVIEQGQRGGMMVVVVLTCGRRVTAHARLQRIHQTDAVDGGVRRRRGRSLEMVRGGGGLHGRAQCRRCAARAASGCECCGRGSSWESAQVPAALLAASDRAKKKNRKKKMQNANN